MNDVVQIRRCSAALRANHFRFRPSSTVQPPPSRRPDTRISNLESPRFVRARLQSCRKTRKFLPALAAEAMSLRLSCRVLIPPELNPSPKPRARADDSARYNIDPTILIGKIAPATPTEESLIGNHFD